MGRWAYCGGSWPSALKSSMCLKVFSTWSSPRMTWVMPWAMSSTTLARWKTGRPVRADDDEVLRVLGLLLHPALHEVGEFEAASPGHAENDAFALPALVFLVGASGGEEFPGGGEMRPDVVRLVDDRLVVIELEPRHAVEKGPDGLRGGSFAVGVLHAEQELAALVAGEEPVEDGGADVADVDLAGGTGSEADAYVRHGRFQTNGGYGNKKRTCPKGGMQKCKMQNHIIAWHRPPGKNRSSLGR
jgi:hypothetical protein